MKTTLIIILIGFCTVAMADVVKVSGKVVGKLYLQDTSGNSNLLLRLYVDKGRRGSFELIIWVRRDSDVQLSDRIKVVGDFRVFDSRKFGAILTIRQRR